MNGFGEVRENVVAGLARCPGCAGTIDLIGLRGGFAEPSAAIWKDPFEIVFQPILELCSGHCVALEALSRFRSGRAPDASFREAHAAGRGIQLELAAVRMALNALESFPEGVSISLNVSPATVISGKLHTALESFPYERIILELTEYHEVPAGDALVEQSEILRSRGARVAIDDLGSGCSRIQELLTLKPDLIKLHGSLIRGIAADRAKQSLVASLVRFAEETLADVVAEGIETVYDFHALRSIGVALGQGWFLGPPQSLRAGPATINEVLPVVLENA